MPIGMINAANPANAATHPRPAGIANADQGDDTNTSFADRLSEAQQPADQAATPTNAPPTGGARGNASRAEGAKTDAGPKQADKTERDDNDRAADKSKTKGAKDGKEAKVARREQADAPAPASAVQPAAVPPTPALPARNEPAADPAADRLGPTAGKPQTKALRGDAAPNDKAAPAASARPAATRPTGETTGFQAALAGLGDDAKDKTTPKAQHSSEILTAVASHGADALPGTNAPATAGAGAAASTAAPGATFDAQLSAAIGTPEFAPALGVQLSVLAREGVQEARLHLNPAEMGPIAVQIAVDGSTAVVHFQADVAATRQALETSLPDLAAAMRDSGFTLSGGSVSSQGSGGQGARGDTDRGAPRAGAASATAAPGGADAATPVRLSAPQAARLRGGVDLFA